MLSKIRCAKRYAFLKCKLDFRILIDTKWTNLYIGEEMDQIKIFVEELIYQCGLTGAIVPIVRHILLIVIAVFLAWLSDWGSRKLLIPIVEKVTAKTAAKWDDVLFSRKVLETACHILPAIVIYELLPLVFYQDPVVREILKRITSMYITLASTRLVIVFINSFRDIDTHKSSSTHQYLLSFCGVLKIIVIFVAIIITISLLIGKSPMGLFAGLGATSAILMLVFKDTIEGLVAGIRLTSNEMLHRGDWITVPSTQADGEVIDMSLTTVKIRNFDNTIVTVSPKTLVEGSFQNWKGMQRSTGRRVKRQVFFSFQSVVVASQELKDKCLEKGYFTEEELKGEQTNMSLYRKYIEKCLPENKYVNANMTYMVRHLEATNTGLPVEFYFFIKDKEWKSYEHQLAEIMEWCYVMAREFGLRIYEKDPNPEKMV